MTDSKECACCSAPKLIFACSGAADVGELTDLAARELTRRGAGRMFCLAGIGGGVSGIIESTRSARSILVIDGCGLNCAGKNLDAVGITGYAHMNLGEMGMQKGMSSPDADKIEAIVAEGAKRLG